MMKNPTALDEPSMLNKLPLITVGFWLLKVSATTLGETAADYLSHDVNLGYAATSLVLFGSFLVLVSLQMWWKRYIPFLFWGVIVATSTAGTAMWPSSVLLGILIVGIIIVMVRQRRLASLQPAMEEVNV
ncbi:MAG: hypothetical protein ABFD92_13385 [Planctomycetaceae bacterium]|nr:hypothetical protein [Planctomycetaceae bacterium]